MKKSYSVKIIVTDSKPATTSAWFDGDQHGKSTEPPNVQKQLQALSKDCVSKLAQVIMECEDAGIPQGRFTHGQILRVLVFHKFHVKKSVRLLRRIDPRYLTMTAQELTPQLMTQTLLPLPTQLEAYTADDLFYMRPSRFVPGHTPTSTIIANLIYVMDSIYERHWDASRTIGFIANMNDWTMEHNFTFDYCLQFMETLQGRKAPVKVNLFLIVNPPKWFGKVWNIMKPMLSSKFVQKVHMISETELPRFLKPGYVTYLPDEFQGGQVSLNDLARDFVSYRALMEQRHLSSTSSSSPSVRKPCPEHQELLCAGVPPKGRRLRRRRRRRGTTTTGEEEESFFSSSSCSTTEDFIEWERLQ
jgi:hypothetical protein